MRGVIDGGVEYSSAPSPQKSSNLEKIQAELRETLNAAEKFRRELEFLQKGGDPLDLNFRNATSVSLQSTSLADQHPEQFLTSEVKGSLAVTASPHGDSVESSGRLGAPSVGEPNSADNLMLFDIDNKICETEKRSLHHRMNSITPSDVALDFPKKSYKRRIRSRPNRDGARSSSTSRDAKGLVQDADNQDQKYLSNFNSKPKSPGSLKNLAFNSRLDVKLNGNQTQKSTIGPASGPVDQPLTFDARETPLSLCSVESGSLGLVKQKTLSDSEHPPSIDTQTVKKGFDSKLSCTRTNQSLEANNENENSDGTVPRNVDSNGTVELNLASKDAASREGNDISTVKDDKILNIANDKSSPCPPNHNDNNSTLQEEEGYKESESALQHESTLSHGCLINGAEQNVCSRNNLKLATKEQEDSILEDARIIEEKRKRISGLSVGIFSKESYHRSHWHFVLEEMSWLANDFAQERIWKAAAGAQISRRAAYNSRIRFQQQKSLWKQKEVSNILAKAVMEFWHTVQVKRHDLELEGPKKDIKLLLRQYGMRFLENNNTCAQYSSPQAPMTPDRISDLGTVDISWDDYLTEENLFYSVPPGAVEAYRKSIESHLLQSKRTDSSMQEGMAAIGYDAVTDGTLGEDMEETSTYYLSKYTQKKKKHIALYGPKSYEMGPDFSSLQSLERNIGTQPSVLSGKRPNSNINSSIPTKRVRTASRPRFTGASGIIQAPNRADASSGDTNSFQDEQSSLHGGSHVPNNMEVESVRDYEKLLHFDQTEVSNRPKKKKKTKHPGSMSDRWQLDSNYQNDQKDHSKRRLDSRQYDSNGNSVASQTSNMPGQNKFMKLLVRDRGRKTKSLKTPSGQQGSGSPWSLFEDQALVVLVHDMGANWELISDAINNTLLFKCISRNSKECKERHKILMDNNSGDGADSAEDSGSSQPYPSTLPGIPEGSARQLFQQLQGPMEESSLKSHFEKIIMICQKPHYRTQKDNQDPKQLQQPHASHALALSQVCPNNLNGGPVLTPLDLCEIISPSPEFIPIGYQGPHSGGLPLPNHGNVAVAPMVPGSSPASSLQGSSASGSHSPSLREGRFGIPRSGSLSIDEQHRLQQFNQMSARNMPQTSLPPGSHSGTDRGVRMLPGGANMGVVNGMNRNMTMARPPFQGTASPSIMNSGASSGQGNSVRPREALNMTRPNQNSDNHRHISAPDLQNAQQPPVQSYQQSPHMPHHHLQGPPNHPAYGMRYMNEKQLHQQRLLQQHFGTSNSIMPHGKQPQQSQIPVSSPQSSTQVQLQSSQQKHPVPTPHGLVRNLQTGANQTVKPPPRHPQFQPPARQHAAKVLKNTPVDSSVMNGFSGSQAAAEKVGQLQQKRYPGQQLPSSSKQLQHQKSKKSMNQIPTTAAERIQNRKENTSDPHPPESNSTGTEGDHSGPAVNNGVVHKQSSSDILPNSAGVQWQHQLSS